MNKYFYIYTGKHRNTTEHKHRTLRKFKQDTIVDFSKKKKIYI